MTWLCPGASKPIKRNCMVQLASATACCLLVCCQCSIRTNPTSRAKTESGQVDHANALAWSSSLQPLPAAYWSAANALLEPNPPAGPRQSQVSAQPRHVLNLIRGQDIIWISACICAKTRPLHHDERRAQKQVQQTRQCAIGRRLGVGFNRVEAAD